MVSPLIAYEGTTWESGTRPPASSRPGSVQAAAPPSASLTTAGSLVPSHPPLDSGAVPCPVQEGNHLSAIVDEEIERIDRVDLDRELDQHVEIGDRLPGFERDARDAIAVRIAQPVQAMLRLDQQLTALDPRARVIGRPQPDQLCGPSSAGLG
jgi:hypothetical protein